MKTNYYFSSFFWSTFSTVFNAIIQFISVPLLLQYFNKDNYGILTLAIATNVYMSLLDLGLNTGAIKYYAQWNAEGKKELLDRVTRTSLSFYGIIGFINASLLLVIAFWGSGWFDLTPIQFQQFKSLLIILSLFSVLNWSTSVFRQLLIANEKMSFVQQIMTVRTALNLGAIGITLGLKLSLSAYFTLYLICNSIIIVPYYFRCRKLGLISSFIPQTYWKDFREVLKYSLAIFIMGLFQNTAARSRPIILGIFTDEGVEVLTEYRIIEVFPMFILSIGGILISILLPKSSVLLAQKNDKEIERFAYEGTLYTSILIAFLSFPIILSAKELLTVYVGEEYSYLHIWLSMWCFTIILYLHNSPVASLVLATGKTRMLVYSSAIACIISIIINSILCKWYGVGSAVIGYLVYIIIQMSFYYFYFNQKIMKLDSWSVFKSFIVPTAVGFIAFLVTQFLPIDFDNQIIQAITKVALWVIMYILALLLLRIVSYKTLISKLKK